VLVLCNDEMRREAERSDASQEMFKYAFKILNFLERAQN